MSPTRPLPLPLPSDPPNLNFPPHPYLPLPSTTTTPSSSPSLSSPPRLSPAKGVLALLANKNTIANSGGINGREGKKKRGRPTKAEVAARLLAAAGGSSPFLAGTGEGNRNSPVKGKLGKGKQNNTTPQNRDGDGLKKKRGRPTKAEVAARAISAAIARSRDAAAITPMQTHVGSGGTHAQDAGATVFGLSGGDPVPVDGSVVTAATVVGEAAMGAGAGAGTVISMFGEEGQRDVDGDGDVVMGGGLRDGTRDVVLANDGAGAAAVLNVERVLVAEPGEEMQIDGSTVEIEAEPALGAGDMNDNPEDPAATTSAPHPFTPPLVPTSTPHMGHIPPQANPNPITPTPSSTLPPTPAALLAAAQTLAAGTPLPDQMIMQALQFSMAMMATAGNLFGGGQGLFGGGMQGVVSASIGNETNPFIAPASTPQPHRTPSPAPAHRRPTGGMSADEAQVQSLEILGRNKGIAERIERREWEVIGRRMRDGPRLTAKSLREPGVLEGKSQSPESAQSSAAAGCGTASPALASTPHGSTLPSSPSRHGGTANGSRSGQTPRRNGTVAPASPQSRGRSPAQQSHPYHVQQPSPLRRIAWQNHTSQAQASAIDAYLVREAGQHNSSKAVSLPLSPVATAFRDPKADRAPPTSPSPKPKKSRLPPIPESQFHGHLLSRQAHIPAASTSATLAAPASTEAGEFSGHPGPASHNGKDRSSAEPTAESSSLDSSVKWRLMPYIEMPAFDQHAEFPHTEIASTTAATLANPPLERPQPFALGDASGETLRATLGGAGSSSGKSSADDSMPKPKDLENSKIYKSYTTLILGDDDVEEAERTFRIGGFIKIRPDGAEGDTTRITGPAPEWIAVIDKIAAQNTSKVFVKIKWCYTSVSQLLQDAGIQFHENLHPNELVVSDHVQWIDAETIDGQATVCQLSNDPLQPNIDRREDYFYQWELVTSSARDAEIQRETRNGGQSSQSPASQKSQSKRKNARPYFRRLYDASCSCGQYYRPDVADGDQTYCCQCRTWYHNKCLGPLRKGGEEDFWPLVRSGATDDMAAELQRRRDQLEIVDEDCPEAGLWHVAKFSIGRGFYKGIAGNGPTVLAARCRFKDEPVPEVLTEYVDGVEFQVRDCRACGTVC